MEDRGAQGNTLVGTGIAYYLFVFLNFILFGTCNNRCKFISNSKCLNIILNCLKSIATKYSSHLSLHLNLFIDLLVSL